MVLRFTSLWVIVVASREKVEAKMPSENLPTCRGSHRGPVIVSATGDEKYRARCLACNTVGPARETSEKAYEALRTLGISRYNGEDE